MPFFSLLWAILLAAKRFISLVNLIMSDMACSPTNGSGCIEQSPARSTTALSPSSGFVIPMSNLFPNAPGNVRSVFLHHTHSGETVSKETCFYCIADVIRNVCEVGQERASEIWRFDTSDAFKDAIQTCTKDHCYALDQFVFHRSPVPVATLASILAIVKNLRGKKANGFQLCFGTFLQSVSPKNPYECKGQASSDCAQSTSHTESPDVTMRTEETDPICMGMCDDTVGMECDDAMEEQGRVAQGGLAADLKKQHYQIKNTVNDNVRRNVEFLYGLFDHMLDTHDQMKKRGLPDAMCREMCGVMLDNARLIGSLTQDIGKGNMPSKSGFIYCLKSDAYPEMVKLGRSKNVIERLAALNTGCAPKPLRVVFQVPTMDAVRDEKRLHVHFASRRGQGEYFNVTPEEVKRFVDTEITPLYIKEFQGC